MGLAMFMLTARTSRDDGEDNKDTGRLLSIASRTPPPQLPLHVLARKVVASGEDISILVRIRQPSFCNSKYRRLTRVNERLKK